MPRALIPTDAAAMPTAPGQWLDAARLRWRQGHLVERVTLTLSVIAVTSAFLAAMVAHHWHVSVLQKESQGMARLALIHLAQALSPHVEANDLAGAQALLQVSPIHPMQTAISVRRDGAEWAEIGRPEAASDVTLHADIATRGVPAQVSIRLNFASLRQAARWTAGLFTLIAVCAAILATFVLQRSLKRLIRPLTALQQRMMDSHDQGDRQPIELPDGPREVRKLAESYNGLLLDLNRREQELRRELDDHRRAREQLHHLAHYDSLTGLLNRSSFQLRLKHAKDRQEPIGLILIDLDDFKLVNDTQGHAAGDALLQDVAGTLSHEIQRQHLSAQLYRLGSDEFAVLVGGARALQNSEILARALLQALPQAVTTSRRPRAAELSASMGLSVFPTLSQDIGALPTHANMALNAARRSGKQRLCVFDADMQARTFSKVTLQRDLRRALLEDSLQLVYEPQVRMDGSLIGAEALLRWRHPERGPVSPGEFIAIAEESDLILHLGEWALARACQETRRALDRNLLPPDFRVGVNLSPRQLSQPDIVATVRRVLDETGLPPEHLELEITESSVLEQLDVIQHRMRALVDLGVHFALDDFGAGATSLAYLKRLPLAKLKIDRSFVEALPHDAEDATISSAIIAMAHKLKLPVLAEGIENRAQYDFLREHSCDMMQGYWIGRACSLGEIFAREYKPLS